MLLPILEEIQSYTRVVEKNEVRCERPCCPRCGERARVEEEHPPPCAHCEVEVRSMEAGRHLIFKGRRLKELVLGLSYTLRGFLRLLRSRYLL